MIISLSLRHADGDTVTEELDAIDRDQTGTLRLTDAAALAVASGWASPNGTRGIASLATGYPREHRIIAAAIAAELDDVTARPASYEDGVRRELVALQDWFHDLVSDLAQGRADAQHAWLASVANGGVGIANTDTDADRADMAQERFLASLESADTDPVTLRDPATPADALQLAMITDALDVVRQDVIRYGESPLFLELFGGALVAESLEVGAVTARDALDAVDGLIGEAEQLTAALDAVGGKAWSVASHIPDDLAHPNDLQAYADVLARAIGYRVDWTGDAPMVSHDGDALSDVLSHL